MLPAYLFCPRPVSYATTVELRRIAIAMVLSETEEVTTPPCCRPSAILPFAAARHVCREYCNGEQYGLAGTGSSSLAGRAKVRPGMFQEYPSHRNIRRPANVGGITDHNGSRPHSMSGGRHGNVMRIHYGEHAECHHLLPNIACRRRSLSVLAVVARSMSFADRR